MRPAIRWSGGGASVSRGGRQEQPKDISGRKQLGKIPLHHLDQSRVREGPVSQSLSRPGS